MKYESMKISGQGAEVFTFRMGKDELRCMRDVLTDVYKKVPESVETLIFRRRVNNMLKCIEKTRILAKTIKPRVAVKEN